MKLNNCFADTETMGLYGPPVIGQFRFDYCNERHDDKGFIYDFWRQPVFLTIALIEEIVKCRVIAHNLTFDWAKITQYYNAVRALRELHGDGARPIDHIDLMAQLIYDHRSDFCLKPPAAVCTLLLCQKELGGAALAAKEIRIRKIPADVAPFVANMLNKNTNLPDILFAKRKTDDRWTVGESDQGEAWSDVMLKFAPSNALKDVARMVLGVEDTQKIGEDFETPEFPFELGYAPYAVLLNQKNWTCLVKNKSSKTKSWRKLWPLLLQEHLDFWTAPNAPQTKYALDDIVLLEKLFEHLGRPDTDFDSELAVQVASVRVAGMPVNLEKLDVQYIKSKQVVDHAEINVDSHIQVREFIQDALDPLEAHVCADSCNAAVLKSIVKGETFTLEEEEPCCKNKNCGRCEGRGVVGPGPMPVVRRAQHVLDIRKHKKRMQMFKKLKISKAAFPSFRVIGTKSGRMSGADKFNYHGVEGAEEIREIFEFTDEGWILCGGDMNSQELAVTAAVMKDENLGDVLRDGKKLHAIFAAEASGIPYKQIMAKQNVKGSPEATWYAKGKVCAYAILYGASPYKVSMDLGCTVEEADEKIKAFFSKFPWVAETRRSVKQMLEALRSDADGRLQIVQPKQKFIESVFGFRRSFECEYAVMGIMFNTMKHWREMTKNHNRVPGNRLSPMENMLENIGLDTDRKVIRKEQKGPQTVKSCVSSALYGAVFSLQGKLLRAAMNHLIQSAGRTCTLSVQKRIWDEVQPVGIHPYRVKLLSVHDEIATASAPETAPQITQAVSDEMAALTETIPLLSLDWATNVGSWYGVKAAIAPDDPGREPDSIIADTFTRTGWTS